MKKLIIPVSTINLSRNQLPQIKSDDMNSFIKQIKSDGIRVSKKKISVKKLKASQGEFNHDKIRGMMQNRKMDRSKTIMVSKDSFIIDGHHRFANELNLNKNHNMHVVQIDLNIFDLIRYAKEWKGSTRKEIFENVKIINNKTIYRGLK